MSNNITISEIYGPVLQGEGPIAGRVTIFVRTFGCDSRCLQCDSLFAVDINHPDAKHRQMTANEIVAEINKIDPKLPVTFSGGNPVIWDLGEVLRVLKLSGHEIWVETQGTYWRDWLTLCDIVVVSPKGPFMADQRLGVVPMPMLKPFAQRTNCHFKVVIGSEADLDYAELIAHTYRDTPMYLSIGCPLVGGNTSTEALLRRYRHLGAVLTNNPFRWSHLVLRAAFIPQLHVLAHGQARGK